jgi:hypothetical protein
MVGYCPLDELEDPAPPQPAPRPRVAPPPRRRVAPARRSVEETECNYVVMFFIVGVIVLALSDNIK